MHELRQLQGVGEFRCAFEHDDARVHEEREPDVRGRTGDSDALVREDGHDVVDRCAHADQSRIAEERRDGDSVPRRDLRAEDGVAQEVARGQELVHAACNVRQHRV